MGSVSLFQLFLEDRKGQGMYASHGATQIDYLIRKGKRAKSVV